MADGHRRAKTTSVAPPVSTEALRWLDYTCPTPVDIKQVTGWDKPLFVGWWFNAHTKEVKQGCSNGLNHSTWRLDKTDTQRAMPPGGFFLTQAEALRALRYELSRRYAADLEMLDKRIAAATAPRDTDKEGV